MKYPLFIFIGFILLSVLFCCKKSNLVSSYDYSVLVETKEEQDQLQEVYISMDIAPLNDMISCNKPDIYHNIYKQKRLQD